MEIYNRELRNIRITLIFLTIILLFSGGNNGEVHVNHEYDDDYDPIEQLPISNMVELGNGYFGILHGESGDAYSQTIQVFKYDETKNSIEFQVQKELSDFEELYDE